MSAIMKCNVCICSSLNTSVFVCEEVHAHMLPYTNISVLVWERNQEGQDVDLGVQGVLAEIKWTD